MSAGDQASSYELESPAFAPGATTIQPPVAVAAPRRAKLAAGAAVDALRGRLVTLLIGLCVFGLAFDGGTYSITSRSQVAIGIWWGLVLLVLLAVWPLARVPRASLVSGGLLAAFACFSALSIVWSDGAENAFTEFNRVALYLGVFAVAVAAARRESADRWSDGIALGITGITFLSLASRLFPHLIGQAALATYFPGDSRPSYPVNYWNGLAVLVALSAPLLLRTALAARGPLQRAAAIAPLPAVASVVYLTSSRTGVLTAVGGVAVFVLLTSQRFKAILGAALAVAGSAAAIVVLHARSELLDGPFNSSPALSQGRSAAILIAVICLVTGVAYALASRIKLRLPRLSRRSKGALAVASAVLAAGAIVAAQPAKRLDDFKQPPHAVGGSYTSSHLLSGGGSGRWQFWEAAVKEFDSKPLIGRGAGSYPAWWAEHGSIPYFTRNAHSLYLQTLGELGVVGFVLLLGFLGWGVGTLARRVRATGGAERATVAALGAAFVGFLLSAALDWMWQLTVVGAIGIALLGLLTGPATEPAGREEGTERRRPARRRLALAAAFALTGILLIAAQGSTLLSQSKIRDSQVAAARNDTVKALSDAKAAYDLEPWAASAALQVALVQEQRADFPAAQTWARRAVRRDPSNWSSWLIAARVESEAGSPAQARASLARAKALNPRSPLFASVRQASR